MEYRTYLFDFDGTLVDSMPSYVGVMLRVLEENNVAYENEIVKTITPLGYNGTAKYYRQLGINRSEEELVALMRSYAYEAYAYHIPAKVHVEEVLRALKARGCALNVLTASPHTVLDVCLKRLGIFDLFDHVWSCEDFGTTKADMAIYRMAAERIGVPIEEILFLDDNYNADACAKQSGIGVCGVYDDSSAEYEADIRAVSDYYIRDFDELLTL